MLKRIFGDPADFAIRCEDCPREYNYEPASKMGMCHLIINNRLIGDEVEECYLPIWVYNLSDRKRRIDQQREKLFSREFEGRSDREIFELILKANQSVEEFDADFLYLPQLSHEIWSSHQFVIDETIDSFLIYFYGIGDGITFLIEEQNGHGRSYDFIFHRTDLHRFCKIIDETIEFLVEQYPYLRQHISTRKF